MLLNYYDDCPRPPTPQRDFDCVSGTDVDFSKSARKDYGGEECRGRLRNRESSQASDSGTKSRPIFEDVSARRPSPRGRAGLRPNERSDHWECEGDRGKNRDDGLRHNNRRDDRNRSRDFSRDHIRRGSHDRSHPRSQFQQPVRGSQKRSRSRSPYRQDGPSPRLRGRSYSRSRRSGYSGDRSRERERRYEHPRYRHEWDHPHRPRSQCSRGYRQSNYKSRSQTAPGPSNGRTSGYTITTHYNNGTEEELECEPYYGRIPEPFQGDLRRHLRPGTVVGDRHCEFSADPTSSVGPMFAISSQGKISVKERRPFLTRKVFEKFALCWMLRTNAYKGLADATWTTPEEYSEYVGISNIDSGNLRNDSPHEQVKVRTRPGAKALHISSYIWAPALVKVYFTKNMHVYGWVGERDIQRLVRLSIFIQAMPGEPYADVDSIPDDLGLNKRALRALQATAQPPILPTTIEPQNSSIPAYPGQAHTGGAPAASTPLLAPLPPAASNQTPAPDQSHHVSQKGTGYNIQVLKGNLTLNLTQSPPRQPNEQRDPTPEPTGGPPSPAPTV